MCAVISVGAPRLRVPQNNSNLSQNVEEITQEKKKKKESLSQTSYIHKPHSKQVICHMDVFVFDGRWGQAP